MTAPACGLAAVDHVQLAAPPGSGDTRPAPRREIRMRHHNG
ncbi:hypothetical protein AB0B51_05895 [Streptomyces griseus]|nr:hypothetical protein [Streptomyces griseus]